MMKKSKPSSRFLSRTTVLVTTMGLFCLASTWAQAATWDGDTSQYWADAGNWDVAPVSGASLTFTGTSNQSNTNNTGITSIGTFTLSNGGWDIKLGGADVVITGITATDSSLLTGNVIMKDGDRTITINGTASTLTLGGKLKLQRSANQTLTVNGTGNTLVLGGLELTDGTTRTRTITGTGNVIINGAVANGGSAAGTLVKTGAGTLTVNGVSTYTGGTTISGGLLALGPVGSINTTPSITLNAGGTFDVSAQSAYTLSTNLFARGTGTSATTAATIKGAPSGTVSLGTLPLKLQWSGALSGVITTNPPLTVTQSQLVFNNNTITVTNSLPFGEGQYTLISAPAGITGTVNSTPVYHGGGKDPNLDPSVKDFISISGTSVVLTIQVPPRGTTISLR
jgi:fibronectin-binding autotransporter adhesin